MALSDFIFNRDSDGIVKSHALFVSVERIFRQCHIGELLDVSVKALFRLEDDSIRIVELLNVVSCDFGELSSRDDTVSVILLDGHTTLLVGLRLENEIFKTDREAMLLQVKHIDSCESCQQLTSLFGSVKFVERVN